MAAGNYGDEVIALLYWGGEILKTGYLGSVDYSEPPKTTCFINEFCSFEELVTKVQAAMDTDDKKKNNTTGLALFGRYPTTFSEDQLGVSASIPLTDNRSWQWFLREMRASPPLHVYVVAAAKEKDKLQQRKSTGAAKKMMKICLVLFLVLCVAALAAPAPQKMRN